ncbi:hypothetical protein ACE1SV_71820 [Streptomyces sennicomposti]
MVPRALLRGPSERPERAGPDGRPRASHGEGREQAYAEIGTSRARAAEERAHGPG